MHILVISDLHLTRRVEHRRLNLLKALIGKADRVIINGDFWEGYIISFDQFLTSGWSVLFPILRKKNTVYLFGNHDAERFSDERTEAFSVFQGQNYALEQSGKRYYFEHGDRLAKIGKEPLDRTLNTQIRFRTSLFIQDMIFRSLGPYAIKFAYDKLNTRIKNGMEGHEYDMLFFGHTHVPTYEPEHRYVNTGFINYGVATYAMIDTDRIHYYANRY